MCLDIFKKKKTDMLFYCFTVVLFCGLQSWSAIYTRYSDVKRQC